MTQFKVGDRVKLVKMGGSVSASWGHKIGATASVVNAEDQMSILIHMDNGPENHKELFVCGHEIEAAIPLTPPATIQHEGYNYTRGEPVVPEWVKDGAWVVEKETGDVMCLSVSKHAVKAININGHIKWYGSAPKNVPSVFRPFTNEDWKWGMWAEYKGEKVFIMSEADTAGNVEISKKPIYKKALSSFTIALSSELTPTTAP